MVANQKFTRVDTVELKAVMSRKIGRRRAEKYFDMLKKFFSLKVGKCEFDKLCVRILGKENLCLHNQLIRTILNNSCVGTVSPLRVKTQSLNSVPLTPRNGRSPVNRDRKVLDRPSPLGPLGKSQQSATELLSLGSRPPLEVVSVEDGEEVEQAAESPSIQSRSPFTAPLGIVVNKGARKALSGGSQKKFHALTCQQTVMESNPCLLGGDWPVLLEKACALAFEE
ncbi:Transcriptional regulator of RNA polII, SAGA, subunit [Heracleum sosnowskyi]|uniref:Transcriptional regulator of RNA polII, SAGA, subunit n=1 Tax=Heracleum sosnowskyi TaxID=360622 RepID=A0AAD8J3L2_9APIA|nr:Transcriptional regulator of RNA polII, SAGA, subunit [Heracleum sosnowskyi]